MTVSALSLAALLWSAGSHAAQEWACWKQAEARYGVPVSLLYAIAKQESGLRSNAIGKNSNGTYDLGLMQINTSWLPKLAKYGIDAKTLILDPCVNLMTGAWVLANNFKDMGYNWRAVGAYNARAEHRRIRYANSVWMHLKRFKEKGA